MKVCPLSFRALCLGLCFLWTPASRAEETPVTVAVQEPDKPRVEVVIKSIRHAADAEKDEVQAASELARYLRAMTGAAIPVGAPNPGETEANTLLVGKFAVEKGMVSAEDLTWCGLEGYVVVIKADRMAVAGKTPKGALYGAYHVLEDLGVRFVPGSERIPKDAPLVLPYAFKRDRPFFDLRTHGSVQHGAAGSLYAAVGEPLKAVEDPKLYPRLWIDHVAGFLVPQYKYFDTHPEYYAHSDDGKVLFETMDPKLNPFHEDIRANRTDMIWLCTSHPDVRKIATATLLDWISKQPEKRFFSIQQGDSDFPCQCKGCRAAGSITDNQVAFANALAEPVRQKYPDKFLLIFAYGETAEIPPTIKPADNVIVLFAPYAPYIRSKIHSFLSHPRNRQLREHFDKWHAVAPRNLGTYDYNDNRAVPFLDKMITQIKEYADRNMRGVWYCGAVSIMPELFTYVNGKLLWDPRQDDKEVIQEFCEQFYGPAGQVMADFVALKRGQVHAENVYYPPIYFAQMDRDFYSRAFTVQALSLFRKAEEAVTGNPALLGRIGAVRDTIVTGYLDAWRGYSPDISAEDRSFFVEALASYLRPLAAQGKNAPKMADFLWRVARLRVNEPWAEDPLMKRFLDSPAATFAAENAFAKPFQEQVPGGWRLPLDSFWGTLGPVYYRWMCPGKNMVSTYSKGTKYHTMHSRLVLEDAPAGQASLEIEGQDHEDDLASARIRLSVNGTVVFEGKNGFVKRGWSVRTFPIPQGTLKKGENRITIENLDPPDDPASGWFIISELKVLFQGG